jgi:hypothetical protein
VQVGGSSVAFYRVGCVVGCAHARANVISHCKVNLGHLVTQGEAEAIAVGGAGGGEVGESGEGGAEGEGGG